MSMIPNIAQTALETVEEALWDSVAQNTAPAVALNRLHKRLG